MNFVKVFLWFFTLTTISCAVDEFEDIKTDDVTISPEKIYVNNVFAKATVSSSSGISVECMTIQLPFGLVDDKGVKHLIVNEASFNILLHDTLSFVIVDFVYPVILNNDLGDAIIVNNLFEFGSSIANCIPDAGQIGDAWLINFDNSCFKIEYPISVMTDNNSRVNILNERDFILLSDTSSSSFIFPIALLDVNNNRFEIKNITDLYRQLATCNGTLHDSTIVWNSNFSYIACYEIVFPISLKITNSDNILMVKNDYELGSILLQGRFEEYVFPLTIKDLNLNNVSVADQDELDVLIDQCFGQPDESDFLQLISYALGEDSTSCYSIIYPFSVTDSITGTIVNFESEVGLLLFLNIPNFFDFRIVYPIKIRLRFANTDRIIQSYAELKVILDGC